MSKKEITHIKCILLLLLYVFSNSPALLFHHHESESLLVKEYNTDEKQLQNTETTVANQQGEQFKIAVEKCALCTHHTVSSHTITHTQEAFLGPLFTSNYLLKNDFLLTLNTVKGSSRAPPIA